MDQIGPVVVEGLAEGQVDDVVHDEGQGEGEDDEGGFGVLVVQGDIHAQTKPIQN